MRNGPTSESSQRCLTIGEHFPIASGSHLSDLEHSDAKLRHLGIQVCRLQRGDDGCARLGGVYDLVYPQPRGTVARVGLLVVLLLDRADEFLPLRVAEFLALLL